MGSRDQLAHLHIPPAIHLQHNAGDELRFVGGEVEAGVGDVAWPRHTAEGDGGDESRAVCPGAP